MIDDKDFIGKFYPQHCGDTLKVIKKSNKKSIPTPRGLYLWECEFQKYPYKIYCQKSLVIAGQIINPEIERVEFVEKIWPQECGDGEEIISGTWKILKDYEIDIYLPKEKIGFEFNGNYWHSEHIKNKYYHLNKLKLANSKGIKLYFIWENEWDENQEKIKAWIQDILSKGVS